MTLPRRQKACSIYSMLRPRKKYTVYDLQQLKGKRCLTHIHVKSPEEATAAEQAGIDLMSCSFDSPEAQARLPVLVAAAPNSFLSCATPHGMASPEEAIRIAFQALELGASSVYCSASPRIIEAMAEEGIPVVGHLGLVPRHATWTGYRAIGKTLEEAKVLHQKMKQLESQIITLEQELNVISTNDFEPYWEKQVKGMVERLRTSLVEWRSSITSKAVEKGTPKKE